MALTKATQNVLEGIVSTRSTGVSAGLFIVAQQYKITALGTTTQAQWNTIAGTTGQTYVVGSLFTAATTGSGSGTGAAAVARTLANRFADVVNVLDFGADPTGAIDSTNAFNLAYVAAPPYGKVFVPDGTYKIDSAITNLSKGITWIIYGKPLGFTITFPFFNNGYLPETIIQTFRNREITYKDGTLLAGMPEGAFWLYQFSLKASWSNYGNGAITGFCSNELQAAGGGTIGVTGAIINNSSLENTTCWAFYSDVQHESTKQSSWSHGLELAIKNKSFDRASNPYVKGGGALGIWLAGGGDNIYGGNATNPSNTGISFIKNAHTWNNGIVFHDTSLTGCDGITGTANAISMAKGHEINWSSKQTIVQADFSILLISGKYYIIKNLGTGVNWAAIGAETILVGYPFKYNGVPVTGSGAEVYSGEKTAYIRSDMTGENQGIVFENGLTVFEQYSAAAVTGKNTAFRISRIDDSVCGISIYPHDTASQGPIISSIGDAANLDLNLVPKGTGRIKMGTYVNTPLAITGYIEIKDASGNLRKLAVVN